MLDRHSSSYGGARRRQPEGKRRHHRGEAGSGRGRPSPGEGDDAGEDGEAEDGAAEEEDHHCRRELSLREEEAESAWVARESTAVDARQGELDDLRQAIDATALKVGEEGRERVEVRRCGPFKRKGVRKTKCSTPSLICIF